MNSRALRRVAGAGSIAGFALSIAVNASAQQPPPAAAPAAPPPAAPPPATPPPAAAQPPPAAAAPAPVAPAPTPSGYMPIVIKGETKDLVIQLKLLSMAGHPDYVDPSGGVSCTGSCQLDVPPGKYRLRVIEPDGRSSDRTITIREPEKFWVGPVDDSARTTGLVLGVVGSVMVPIGLYVMLDGLANSFDGNDRAGYGLLIFAAGAALAPVGWVMFGKNGRFSLERQALDQPSAAKDSHLTLGVAALPGGGVIGGSFNF